jgi:hypothetical protein
MKKRFLSGIFALALLLTASHGVYESMNSNANVSGLVSMNVEALASGENGGESLSCWKNINSQGNQITTHKTYCGTCEPVTVHSWSNEGTCKK